MRFDRRGERVLTCRPVSPRNRVRLGVTRIRLFPGRKKARWRDTGPGCPRGNPGQRTRRTFAASGRCHTLWVSFTPCAPTPNHPDSSRKPATPSCAPSAAVPCSDGEASGSTASAPTQRILVAGSDDDVQPARLLLRGPTSPPLPQDRCAGRVCRLCHQAPLDPAHAPLQRVHALPQRGHAGHCHSGTGRLERRVTKGPKGRRRRRSIRGFIDRGRLV
jgi:hypothetical protein